MKTTRKLTALWAVLGLLLTLWAPMAVSADAPAPATPQAELFYFGRSVLEQMPNGAALCYAYDKVVEGCAAAESTVDISHRGHTLSIDEAFLVYEAVMADHPAFFWLADGVRAKGSGNTATALLFYVPKDVEQTRSQLDARVAELTAGLEGKSDYEKSRILHDRVCEAVVYYSNAYDQSVVGSLLYGTAVCAGYTRAYQWLLHTVGIPSFCVTGHSRAQAHAWNLVQLDGEWYYTDVTWDDQNDAGGYIYYAYLNNTFAQIEEDHTAVDFVDYLPRSTATANNYHVQNGLVLPSFDADQVAAILRKGNPGRIYVTGDMNAFLSNLQTKLNDVAGQLAQGSYGYSCRMAYMGRELILSLNINHPHRNQTDTVAATCTADGTVTTICRDCGQNTVEIIPALGHDIPAGWWHNETEHGRSCSRCDHVEAVSAHVYDGDNDAECNECGYTREVATVTPGDTDGDGKVNNRDLGRLQQYLNEWNVTVDLNAADLDGNERVNNRDLGLLQRMLNE